MKIPIPFKTKSKRRRVESQILNSEMQFLVLNDELGKDLRMGIQNHTTVLRWETPQEPPPEYNPSRVDPIQVRLADSARFYNFSIWRCLQYGWYRIIRPVPQRYRNWVRFTLWLLKNNQKQSLYTAHWYTESQRPMQQKILLHYSKISTHSKESYLIWPPGSARHNSQWTKIRKFLKHTWKILDQFRIRFQTAQKIFRFFSDFFQIFFRFFLESF